MTTQRRIQNALCLAVAACLVTLSCVRAEVRVNVADEPAPKVSANCPGHLPHIATRVSPHERAGYPQRVAKWAIPSVTPRYSAGYVGGGAVVLGHPRMLDEGTWGLDYTGSVVKRRVWLKWWHGRKHQGGGGSYKTDGPHLPKH